MSPEHDVTQEISQLLLTHGSNHQLSIRKLRLLSVTLLRHRGWDLLSKDERRLLDYVEMLADLSNQRRWCDGLSDRAQSDCFALYQTIQDKPHGLFSLCRKAVRGDFSCEGERIVHFIARVATQTSEILRRDHCIVTAPPLDPDLIRCIVGPLTLPSPMNPIWLAWNDFTVSKCAEHIYRERDFRAMPILADALEEAGCDDPKILSHCKTSVHTHGCWLLDYLTGRDQIGLDPVWFEP